MSAPGPPAAVQGHRYQESGINGGVIDRYATFAKVPATMVGIATDLRGDANQNWPLWCHQPHRPLFASRWPASERIDGKPLKALSHAGLFAKRLNFRIDGTVIAAVDIRAIAAG
jgi:hypothetical protein